LPEPPFHEPVDKSTTKTFFSQLTCSSKYGYFAAACQSGKQKESKAQYISRPLLKTL
jgi:hypothetical protein